ncbi:MAG: hypothetical protein ACK5JH_14115 [Anaerocolumna sp.]
MFKNFMRNKAMCKKNGKIIVGVCSTHKGAGATHFSMMLGTYLSEWLGLKTAFIDFNHVEGLADLKDYFLQDSKTDAGNHFTVGRITFYNKENLNRLSEIIGGEADCIILDLGSELLENMDEFLRCDFKIVVSSLAVWKQYKLNRFLDTVSESFMKSDWKYIIPFVDDKTLKDGISTYRIHLCQMPYHPDPFIINPPVIHFFERILQR